VELRHGELYIMGIEQNPQTASQWTALARTGKRIVQFRCKRRYIANVCEGKLLRYPAWTALALPDCCGLAGLTLCNGHGLTRDRLYQPFSSKTFVASVMTLSKARSSLAFMPRHPATTSLLHFK